MDIDKKTAYGGIDISLNAIAQIAGEAAKECYGVLGIGKKNSDSNEVLDKADYEQGIVVTKSKGSFIVDIYLQCAYGLKVSEIVSEAQKKIKYELEKTFGLKFSKINVFIVDLKESN
ncbi:MAG: Asp23/Gls24 family envelope stress response protein [Bacilli bacterium]|nr:Asp23/Gls24 family envelope stress response protein [Bacilli bacterium]MDY6430293.1 Asp23/Gls24 family envelope stress response protein [Bacilli bacterium]